MTDIVTAVDLAMSDDQRTRATNHNRIQARSKLSTLMDMLSPYPVLRFDTDHFSFTAALNGYSGPLIQYKENNIFAPGFQVLRVDTLEKAPSVAWEELCEALRTYERERMALCN